MYLSILLLSLVVWQKAATRVIEKRQIFFQSDLLKGIISFFLSFSLIAMSYVVSKFCSFSYIIFLLSVSLFSLFFYFYFRLIFFKPGNFNLKKYDDKTLFTVLVSLLILSSLFIDYATKWGGWDSFAIWTSHAKFLTCDDWRNYLTNDLSWSHPDYPLMLSSYIAVIWESMGSTSGIIPSIVAYMILISIALAGYSSLSDQNFKFLATFFLFVIAFNVKFIEISSWLNADILLALFFLISFILFQHSENGNNNILILLGFFAGCCGWIKNEGILFFIIFSLYFIFLNIKKRENIAKFLYGSVIPLVMIIVFKLFYAPDNDIMSGQSNSTIERIFSFKRYEVIYRYLLNHLLADYYIILIASVTAIIFSKKYFKSFEFKVLTTVMAGYFFIYVITPMDLKWHLETSLSRLLHQLYPSFIYTMFCSMGNSVSLKKEYFSA